MNINKWLAENTHELTGKVVAMTGTTGGLGKILCEHLVRLGANVIMLDRNLEKSQAQKERLLKKYPKAKIKSVRLDLSDWDNVQMVAAALQGRRLDYFILNSGAYNIPVQRLSTGYNNVFQINFLAPYYLVRTLMPTLAQYWGKVIAVGSVAHRRAKLDETDWDYSRRKKNMKVYGNAKRWLMLSLTELFRQEKRVRLVIAHPGVTLTPMTNHYHPAVNWIVRLGMKIVFPKPEKAVLSLLAAVYTDCPLGAWIGPERANVWGWPIGEYLHFNPEEQERIAAHANEIYQRLASTTH